jgi:hypothetical protein
MVQSIQPLMMISERSLYLRKYLTLTAIIFFSTLIAVCTISHKFGPFMGKVVDAETGKPVEGAVVLIGFFTETGTFGGTARRFADAVETLTDAKGEFRISPKQVNLFRKMASWDEDCHISIFKPGYGTYPKHPKTFISPGSKRSLYIPENEYITYHLPKLFTLKERKDNLFSIMEPAGIPNEKMPNMQRLKNEEYINVGID